VILTRQWPKRVSSAKQECIFDVDLFGKVARRTDNYVLLCITGVVFKTFHKFNMNDTLADVASALDHDPYVLIVSEQRCFSSVDKKRKVTATESEGAATEAPKKYKAKVVHLVSGIVSRIDLLDFIARREADPDASPVKEGSN
jgi:hypothetical protein